LPRYLEAQNGFAAHAVEVRVVVGVLSGGAVVAQGVVGFPVLSRYFVNYPLIKKTLQDAVHSYAVNLSRQPLHDVGVAERPRFMLKYLHYQLLAFRVSSLLFHKMIFINATKLQ
jgi:hypothetical protein